MTDVERYLREDLRGFGGYSSARASAPDDEPVIPPEQMVWLNANERYAASTADPDEVVRRYPDPQPPELTAAAAGLFAVSPERVLVGRGSDELIRLIITAVCQPGAGDAILISPPTFDVYRIDAVINGSDVVTVPLVDDPDAGTFTYPVDDVVAAITDRVKLIFMCTPGNPTGQLISLADVEKVAAAALGRALVVCDEAYLDFSRVDGEPAPSGQTLQRRFPNIVVLRTLSKAHALAGARVGIAIAAPELIAAFGVVQDAYPVPSVVARLAVAALDPVALAATAAIVDDTIVERSRVEASLAALPNVRTVYASESNFFLVRFTDAQAALRALLGAGIVVRDFTQNPDLPDGLRISVGSREQNDRVIETLGSLA